MERFVFVLPIRLHEYNENAPENGDFWKQRLKWRLWKWSRKNACKCSCKQQKLIYFGETEVIGSWLLCDWTGRAHKNEHKIEQQWMDPCMVTIVLYFIAYVTNLYHVNGLLLVILWISCVRTIQLRLELANSTCHSVMRQSRHQSLEELLCGGTIL